MSFAIFRLCVERSYALLLVNMKLYEILMTVCRCLKKLILFLTKTPRNKYFYFVCLFSSHGS